MTNALNELDGRIAARQRKRVRAGRSFFAEARKFGGVAGGDRQLEARIAEPENTGCTEAGTTYDRGTAIHPHELTSDNPNDESHFRAFTTALNLGLDPLHERRNGHSRFFVICSDEHWKAIQEVVK